MSGTGRLEGIFVAPEAFAPMIALEHARALAGRGLEGDRYALGTGFYSDGQDGRQITLIEAEALEALPSTVGVELTQIESRRNLVTRGVRLNDLVGRRFMVGDVTLEGIRLCPPCNHLEELTRPGPLKGLARSGGLRAHILNDGELRTGDAIQV